MTNNLTLIEEVEHDLEFTKKLIMQKNREIAEINLKIEYEKGMYDGANNILQLIKKHFEAKQ